ncbi:hypothetical protein BZA77DRAFT_306700 [Pyronema omphalodes]|nr:hypothetical protein BZA77DRAFT_306700 [Pyronema omphalodes]
MEYRSTKKPKKPSKYHATKDSERHHHDLEYGSICSVCRSHCQHDHDHDLNTVSNPKPRRRRSRSTSEHRYQDESKTSRRHRSKRSHSRSSSEHRRDRHYYRYRDPPSLPFTVLSLLSSSVEIVSGLIRLHESASWLYYHWQSSDEAAAEFPDLSEATSRYDNPKKKLRLRDQIRSHQEGIMNRSSKVLETAWDFPSLRPRLPTLARLPRLPRLSKLSCLRGPTRVGLFLFFVCAMVGRYVNGLITQLVEGINEKVTRKTLVKLRRFSLIYTLVLSLQMCAAMMAGKPGPLFSYWLGGVLVKKVLPRMERRDLRTGGGNFPVL